VLVTENVYNFKLVLEIINHVVEEALHELRDLDIVLFAKAVRAHLGLKWNLILRIYLLQEAVPVLDERVTP
jgi:hypothetical protein